MGSLQTATYTGIVNVPSSVSITAYSHLPALTAATGSPTLHCNLTAASNVTSGLATLTGSSTATALTQTLPTTIDFAQVIFYPGPQYVAIASFEISATSSNSAISNNGATSSSGAVNPTVTSTIASSASSQFPSTTGTVSSTTPSPTNSAQPDSTAFSIGDLAGVAVGCLIGGVILAALAACLFMRQKSRKRHNVPAAGREMSSLNGHGEAVYLAGGKSWESHLPQSESDGTIRGMANRTLDQIEMYVENFYQDTTFTHLRPEVQSKVAKLDSPHLPSPIMTLLPQSSRPTALIKHCIANLIVTRIAASANSSALFLPSDFRGLQPSLAAQRKPGFAQALSTWRVLTVYLRTEPEHDAEYESERDRSIDDAAQLVCQAFEPWARSADQARIQSLVSIMKRASDLGITLFSQPSAFQWQWHAQGKSIPNRNDATKIVVLPGLYKTTDQDARPLSFPLCLIEPRLSTLTRR